MFKKLQKQAYFFSCVPVSVEELQERGRVVGEGAWTPAKQCQDALQVPTAFLIIDRCSTTYSIYGYYKHGVKLPISISKYKSITKLLLKINNTWLEQGVPKLLFDW